MCPVYGQLLDLFFSEQRIFLINHLGISCCVVGIVLVAELLAFFGITRNCGCVGSVCSFNCHVL